MGGEGFSPLAPSPADATKFSTVISLAEPKYNLEGF